MTEKLGINGKNEIRELSDSCTWMIGGRDTNLKVTMNRVLIADVAKLIRRRLR